jgi:hypothetical protein
LHTSQREQASPAQPNSQMSLTDCRFLDLGKYRTKPKKPKKPKNPKKPKFQNLRRKRDFSKVGFGGYFSNFVFSVFFCFFGCFGFLSKSLDRLSVRLGWLVGLAGLGWLASGGIRTLSYIFR